MEQRRDQVVLVRSILLLGNDGVGSMSSYPLALGRKKEGHGLRRRILSMEDIRVGVRAESERSSTSARSEDLLGRRERWD